MGTKPTALIPSQYIAKRDSLMVGALVMQVLRAEAGEERAQAWREAQHGASNWDEWLESIAPFCTLDIRDGYRAVRSRRRKR